MLRIKEIMLLYIIGTLLCQWYYVTLMDFHYVMLIEIHYGNGTVLQCINGISYVILMNFHYITLTELSYVTLY